MLNVAPRIGGVQPPRTRVGGLGRAWVGLVGVVDSEPGPIRRLFEMAGPMSFHLCKIFNSSHTRLEASPPAAMQSTVLGDLLFPRSREATHGLPLHARIDSAIADAHSTQSLGRIAHAYWVTGLVWSG